MDEEILIRVSSEKPAPADEPKATDAHNTHQQQPTECGLTREELRAIVAEIIG